MEEHEVQELVNELLERSKAETKRKLRFVFFATIGVACCLFGAWTGNANNETPQWLYDVRLHDGALIFIGFGFIAVSASYYK